MASSREEENAPIAIVGLGCRFPGSATSISSLWEMLTKGESAWSEIPKDRMDISSYFHPDNARQGSIPFRGAHFLRQEVGAFDNSFFSISADEAKAMDPQQRMLLEVAVEALDSAGIDRSSIRGSETGVWVGSFVKDYEQIVLRDPDNAPKYGATGNGIAIMSNRISFFLDINGPSMTIDTGCSASLVCVHNAVQSLRDGEVDLALAGGAGLILTPATMMPMTALNFLSPDGKCYTFDSRANGYGRGEGIGIIVLKRLEDAIRDNDNIRAVIRGSRVNQDGRTAGITLPSSEAQIRNIRGVYAKAGLDFDKTAFVECHGTGTKAGDWREVKAISDALCTKRPKDSPIYIGSIKTNIGHLEGCAGIAGLIKGVLTVENGLIPRHINFEVPNPDIDFEGQGVKVPTENTPWPLQGLRRASINCFGFGGTNAHVIIDDAAHYLAARGLSAHHNTIVLNDTLDPLSSSPPPSPISMQPQIEVHENNPVIQGLPIPPRNGKTHLFAVSANEKRSLHRLIRNLATYVQGNSTPSPDFLSDLAYTLGCRRTKMQWRTSVVASSSEELAQQLSRVSQTSFIRTSEEKPTKVAFIFGGQGAQWFAMGRELLGFDIFLQSMAEATLYLKNQLGSTFNLLGEVLKDKASTRIDEPEIAQPATTAIQVALVLLLIDYLGVVPVSVCGHSSGEIAAAYALGTISKEDAWQIAYYRGQCAAALRTSHKESGKSDQPSGRMLAVGLPAEQAQRYVDEVGSSKVTIACINSPVSVTLSGDEDAVVRIQKMLEAVGVFNRLLLVSTAYHSHHMKRCESVYMDSISHIMPRSPTRTRIPQLHARGGQAGALGESLGDAVPVMYSSVTGGLINWECLRPEYWVKNIVSPVRFSEAMHSMMSSDGAGRPDIIVELGPHSYLQSPVKQILDAEERLRQRPSYFSLLSRNKDAAFTTLEVLGELWSRGCPVAMEWVIMRNVEFRRPRLLVDLPNYPWNHDKIHWHESHLSVANRFQKHGRYDLIGRPTADSIPSQPRWRGFLRVSENPWLRHHQVQKSIIYPAAGMIAMVVEAARQLATSDFEGVLITQFRILKAMLIQPTPHGLEYALNMTKSTGDVESPAVHEASMVSENTPTTYRFFIYSKPLDASWQEHGHGLVTLHRDPRPRLAGIPAEYFERTLPHAEDYFDEVIIPRQLYETLDTIGMNYGDLFQNITTLRKRDDECLGTVRVPNTKKTMPSKFEYSHIIHPATLDSVFHTAFAIGSEPMVPSYISSCWVSADTRLSTQGRELTTYTKAQRRQLRNASATFVVSDKPLDNPSDPISEPLVVIKDMTFTALTTSPDDVAGAFLPNHRNLCSEVVWEPCEVTQEHDFTSQANRETPVLVLIPEDMAPCLDNLLVALSEELNAIPRTLKSITKEETLPALCLSLLEADGQHLLWNMSEQEFSALRTVVLKINGMFWMTRASQIEVSDPRCGLFQALARTVHSEFPEKTFVVFDAEKDMCCSTNCCWTKAAEGLSRRILSLFRITFFASGSTAIKEAEYAERGGQLMVPRLVPIKPLNNMIERGSALPEPELKLMHEQNDRALQLKIREIGDVDSLCWEDDPLAYEPLPSDHVKVRVLSAALSPLDADVVMGRAKDALIGTDLYGVVEEIGGTVTNVAVGDHVLGITRGSLRDLVRCHHDLVHKCPTGELQPYHVFLPTPFSVAQYSFGKRLGTGEAVLVREGASAMGQAAIQLAHFLGATVFATVKTDRERTILRGCYGMPDDHVLDANTGAWVDTFLQLTKQKGAAVIYDPKTVDVAALLRKEPKQIGKALAFVCDNFIAGRFKVSEPVPLNVYDYSRLPEAFKKVAEEGHYGQVYCRRPEDKAVPILPRSAHPASQYLRNDATYVLAGGLGGLGIEIAKLLAANGVKHIAFISRSGARTELAKACVNFLQGRGVEVLVVAADICDRDNVEDAAREIARKMPPVRGVFQCAATLRDAVFETMSYADWRAAVRPKTLGSWNLKEVFLPTPGVGPDPHFFVFLSSSAGVIGNRGQANYAVGNAFQDALAAHIDQDPARPVTRAVSIDLGPVLGAGMLAEDPRTLDLLKASGFFGIRLQDFRTLVERAIAGYLDHGKTRVPAQVVTGVGTGGLLRQNKPADPYWTRTALFSRLNKVDLPAEDDEAGAGAEAGTEQQSFPRRLKEAADSEEATAIVSEGLRTMLSRSMNVAAEDVDENRALSAYGVDSLVAVGVRNWVYRECGVDMSVFEVLNDQSILELSGLIVQKGGLGSD
ncbi:hypothetical protein DL768_008066 [Monosporascus sp. mg162]|nr:hypothetical protein DL768_008066 [Monosporascus sp. mg162]